MNFEKSSLEGLDSGKRIESVPPSTNVRVGRLVSHASGKAIAITKEQDHPSIIGVEIKDAQTYRNERRDLIVAYNNKVEPGVLGYTAAVHKGCAVGDHSHWNREESIILVYGTFNVRLHDRRTDSETHDEINIFGISIPGQTIVIPIGVSHSLMACTEPSVLQVKASEDYNSHDDYIDNLSNLSLI